MLPQIIQEIGSGIDMVILDTVHALPGEILDFLCIFPYLAENAIVVVHDITRNFSEHRYSFATKVLLDSVSGEKYFNLIKRLPNIGAFRITEETMLNIENVFSALSITWGYFVDAEILMDYRKIYQSFYPEECLKLFDQIVLMQKIQYQCYGLYSGDVEDEVNRLLKICDSGKHLYLYGAGIRGQELKAFILRQGFKIDGFIISDDYEPEDFVDLKENIFRISEMPKEEHYLILATPAQEVLIDLVEKDICFEFFSEKFFVRIAELGR